ncbi:hypothetical protein QBC40DRAFT_306403 [Triangularia verruculosa]|uniref:Terpenoid synthase n=1 Tax=Triangularia verruculosa TaxID=2587418 RepID=A0AAN7ATQ9_9PEZI|nr:hypothetical protein QBC40DRAFT_306403 [Triangularia verruculosa]
MADLKGQTLVIPPVQRQVSTWKATRHPHPLHEHLKTDIIDPILSELITHPRALQKAIESDIARLVCGLCPSITAWAHAPKLRTVAEFLVWIVLWDDGIDSPGEGGEFDAEEYVRRSKEYVRWCLLRQHERLNAVREEAAVEPPTKVCELMERVGCGLMDQHGWVEAERNRLWEGLGRYMDACLVEYKVRVSRSDEVPTIDEFWKWRTGTSGVEAFCVMGRVMTAGCWLPDEFVEKSEELRYMGACVNRAFVM